MACAVEVIPLGMGPAADETYGLIAAVGGGYGGVGADTYVSGTGGYSYGSITAPIDLGSGGASDWGTGGSGGGTVRLQVGGTLLVDGGIVADGSNGGRWAGGGSGGSIWITTGRLAGGGVISANGGNGDSVDAGGGSGGRIAVEYAAIEFDGSYSARPGSGEYIGGAGTQYFKNTTSGLEFVVIDADGMSAAKTPIDAGVYESTFFVTDNALAELQGPVHVAGLHVDDGGVVTSSVQQPFYLTTEGDITVGVGARISVNGKGHGSNAGPGAGQTYYAGGGGGYGGAGGGGYFKPYLAGQAYGSNTEPVDLGSGGGYWIGSGGAGGGAIRLDVGGTVTVDGTISANGFNGGSQAGGGSGGTIWIAADTLSGSGTITANGGNGSGGIGGGGGGGRIAIYNNTFADFNPTTQVTVTPGSGWQSGQPGTIYTEGNDRAPVVLGSQTTLSGYVLQPVDHVDIAFSQPIDAASLTAANVTVWGLGSRALPLTSIESLGTYGPIEYWRISFPQQSKEGNYGLRISSEVIGQNGLKLDQDRDNNPGEQLEDKYEVQWRIDRTPPRITRHVPGGDLAGTVGFVDVYFNEPITEASFTTDDVKVTNPSGGSISPSGIVKLTDSQYRVSFPAQTAYGQYEALIGVLRILLAM